MSFLFQVFSMSKGILLLVGLLCTTSAHAQQNARAIDSITQGLNQISDAARNGLQEKRDMFVDTAGNIYSVVRDASGAATNYVKDKAGAVYDVTQLAGSFLMDSITNYPEELRQSVMDSYDAVRETAADFMDAASEIGSAARNAMPKLPPLKKMNEPIAWVQTFALNNLYMEQFRGTVEEQLQQLGDGLSAKYCTAGKFKPSYKKQGIIRFPGAFKLKFSTKECAVDEMDKQGYKLNCTGPAFSMEKVAGEYVSKHHTAPEFKSKECKFEKEHGSISEIVLAEFNGHDPVDMASIMDNVEKSVVTAYNEADKVPEDVDNFMNLLPELQDVEADFLDLLTAGLPEVQME